MLIRLPKPLNPLYLILFHKQMALGINFYCIYIICRMYKSGDLGYFQEDDLLIISGRIDSQVKIRGLRIEIPEIEHHLSNYSGIRVGIVVIRNLKGANHLIAYYVESVCYLLILSHHIRNQ